MVSSGTVLSSSLRRRRVMKAATSSDEEIKGKTAENFVGTVVDSRSGDLLACSAVRNIALWRMSLFCILLVFEWDSKNVLSSPGSLDLTLDMTSMKPGRDRWFSYNHLEWVQDLHAYLSNDILSPMGFKVLGYLCCFLAAFGVELGLPWKIPTIVFTLLYSICFLANGANYTNHNYLYILLMILTLLSGGGHLGVKMRDRSAQHLRTQAEKCVFGTVLLRAQFAIIYLFASIWKIHPDWFSGSIVRIIFLGLEQGGASRGIQWSKLEQTYGPHLFVFVAAGGLFLDSAMFMTLAFVPPKTSATKLFLAFTLSFHCFTTYAMSQRIGYSFPATCIAGIFVFLPVLVQSKSSKNGKVQIMEDCDRSVAGWLVFYMGRNKSGGGDKAGFGVTIPSRTRRWFGLFWVAMQILIPLRMPIVSRGKFPLTGVAYRWSWTMMLHSRTSMIEREVQNKDGENMLVALQLDYISPTCFGASTGKPDLHMPREVYMKGTDHPMSDSRTLPMHALIGPRQEGMLNYFPSSFLYRIAGGVAKIIDQMVNSPCGSRGFGHDGIGMSSTLFAQLNENGPFSRIVDPEVNLVATYKAQTSRSVLSKWWGALVDATPLGHEFILEGVGSLRVESQQHEHSLQKRFPQGKVHLIADRALCLKGRPLWLKPMRLPLLVVPLKVPYGFNLLVSSQSGPLNSSEKETKILDQPFVEHGVQATAMEISAVSTAHETSSQHCRDTKAEDTLFAIIF